MVLEKILLLGLHARETQKALPLEAIVQLKVNLDLTLYFTVPSRYDMQLLPEVG